MRLRLGGHYDTCVRCGAAVPWGRSTCQRCNPAGLPAPSPSQYHATVLFSIVGTLLLVVLLVILVR
jgi:predicted nucleic acid-binding Zn ribbon protein